MSYIKNIIIALLGRNPYQEELDGLQEKYDKAAQNVSSLQDMYYGAVERWTEADKQARSLQALVEQLRERIREKDAIIGEMEKDYQQRGRENAVSEV